MLTSMVNSKWDMIEEQASLHLNENEQATLRYYMKGYKHGQITLDGLVMALMQLLNTHSKVSYGSCFVCSKLVCIKFAKSVFVSIQWSLTCSKYSLV